MLFCLNLPVSYFYGDVEWCPPPELNTLGFPYLFQGINFLVKLFYREEKTEVIRMKQTKKIATTTMTTMMMTAKTKKRIEVARNDRIHSEKSDQRPGDILLHP